MINSFSHMQQQVCIIRILIIDHRHNTTEQTNATN